MSETKVGVVETQVAVDNQIDNQVEVRLEKVGHVGEVRFGKFGKVEEIIDENEHGIKVQCENGTIIETTYEKFQDGKARYDVHEILSSTKNRATKRRETMVAMERQNDEISDYKMIYSVRGRKNYRVGEVYTSTQGQLMKIVAYVTSRDVSVQFEDNTIVNHKKYDNIVKGQVKNPNLARKKRVATPKKVANS
jgi:uncharacterized protein YkvS